MAQTWQRSLAITIVPCYTKQAKFAWWGTGANPSNRVFFREINKMKRFFAAAAAVAMLGFAGSALAAADTTATAGSTVASGSANVQLSSGTSVGASTATNTTNSNAQALSLQPVFSAVHAGTTTTGSAANVVSSNAPFSLNSSFSFQAGTGTATASAH